jgi:serine/threonine protein kinase
MVDCKEPGVDETAVIIDLGSACFADNKECKNTSFGTLDYMTPERIMATNKPDLDYDASIDIWAVGVLTWELLTGDEPPFYHSFTHITVQRILNVYYTFPKEFTADQREFLSSIFKKDPKERPTAEELLKSKWLSG